MSQDGTRTARRLLSAAGLLCLAGCMGAPAPLDDDPLIGGRRLPISARGGTPKVESASADEVPYPPARSTSSTAALAVAAGTRSQPRESSADSVKLLQPRSLQAGGRLPAIASEANYEQLQERLQAHGVIWQQLKTTVAAGEWHFICAIPIPNSDGMQRQYEAKAVGPHGLAAIRAVLGDIEKDQPR
jgi:hypothetical protein